MPGVSTGLAVTGTGGDILFIEATRMKGKGDLVLTAQLVAEAAGGRLVAGQPDVAFDAVSTDTRSLGPGALFIALRGERFDGHAFVPDAVARGAAGLLVSEPVTSPRQAAGR